MRLYFSRGARRVPNKFHVYSPTLFLLRSRPLSNRVINDLTDQLVQFESPENKNNVIKLTYHFSQNSSVAVPHA